GGERVALGLEVRGRGVGPRVVDAVPGAQRIVGMLDLLGVDRARCAATSDEDQTRGDAAHPRTFARGSMHAACIGNAHAANARRSFAPFSAPRAGAFLPPGSGAASASVAWAFRPRRRCDARRRTERRSTG